jgi:uncharacterized damage-inducible protein DinB
MYRSIGDFQTDWGFEADKTLKIFRALTEESLAQKVTEDGRSLGFIAWHIAVTLGEMLEQAGIKIDSPASAGSDLPPLAEIVSTYEKGAKLVGEEIARAWKDEEMDDEIPMYGTNWKKGMTLYALIAHQIHHRGQMSVLMRQAGLRVPGVYGPAREEWTEYGIAAEA